MEILRVETFSKVGLYCSQCERPETEWNRHPLPSDDNLIGEIWRELLHPYQWYFGFKDMSQLLKWWPRREWEYFIRHNEKSDHSDNRNILGISTYDVDPIDLHIGETQVIFILDKAERLRFEPFLRDNVQEKIINVMTGQ